MVVALVVVGVIAFLVVDTYVIYRVLQSRGRADDHGTFAVPGELTVTLPTGHVRLSYQEGYRAQGGDGEGFGVPGGLEIAVVSPSGATLEIKRPGLRGAGSVTDTGRGWSRALIGTVEVVEPGDHTISARPEPEGAIAPRVLVGR